MKTLVSIIVFNYFSLMMPAYAQMKAPTYFPKHSILYKDVAYTNDTLLRHRVDIYVGDTVRALHPIIFWIHGGGWRFGDKSEALDNLHKTVKSLVKNGFAIVAINYRYSTTDIFPAQIKDCNEALEFVCQNAARYRLDTSRIVVVGISAGGHLAALMGLSNNNNVRDFHTNNKPSNFRISAVIDYFGLSDFNILPPAEQLKPDNGPGLLFGGAMNERLLLVKAATPLNYIDSEDPPFLIIHGDRDDLMDIRQSIALNDSLQAHHVPSKFMVIKGAPHGGEMFDKKQIRLAVQTFLKKLFQ